MSIKTTGKNAATPPKQDYVVLADGRVNGRRVSKGDTVQLTERQAKYENVKLKADDGSKSSTAKAAKS